MKPSFPPYMTGLGDPLPEEYFAWTRALARAFGLLNSVNC